MPPTGGGFQDLLTNSQSLSLVSGFSRESKQERGLVHD